MFAFFLGQGGQFLQLVFVLLLLFPLSSDPLQKIPEERLQGWPLTSTQRISLRVASIWFSPIMWITLAILVWASSAKLAAAFFGASTVCYALTTTLSGLSSKVPRLDPLRHLPAVRGAIGGLLRKNLRELLTILDPYAALILTICGVAYRSLAPKPEPDAFMVLSLLVTLALSTYALNLFGLDTASGFTRYHLLPLAGWKILLAKDLAFLLVLTIFVLPLNVLAGLSSGFLALAVGHRYSTRNFVAQSRWRFTGGASLPAVLIQTFLMVSAGTLAARTSPLFLLLAILIFVASLWYFGRDLDRAEF